MHLSQQKHSEIAKQNAALKAELRAAKRKIRSLEQQAGRSSRIRPDQVELDLMRRIADCDIDSGFAVDFAADLNLAPARLDYHLQRLVDGGYIEMLFTDSALGEDFAITQKGRHALVKRRLI